MNSLYGRFGINPKSTTAVICDEYRYKHLLRHSELILGEMLSENNYLVTYHCQDGLRLLEPTEELCCPTRRSQPQQGSICTLISQERTYTDTDSVVLGQPLPKEVLSSSVLGKFKLEDRVVKGSCTEILFLPIRRWQWNNQVQGTSEKHGHSRMVCVTVRRPISYRTGISGIQLPDWLVLTSSRKKQWLGLGLSWGQRGVYDRDVCVGANWYQLSSLNHIGKQIIKLLKNNVKQLQKENQILNEKLSQKEREYAERYKEIQSQYDAINNTLLE